MPIQLPNCPFHRPFCPAHAIYPFMRHTGKIILHRKKYNVMTTTITTERLCLRPFMEKDAAALLTYLGNPRVNCFKDQQLSATEDALRYIAEKQKNDLCLAICLKDTDELIGELFAEKEEPDTYGVGWHLNQLFEGKGYAFEAARAFISWLFDSEGARRVYGYVESDNLRSQNLCKRLGMRYEGCFKEFISFVNNHDGTPKYEDTCIYTILKKEWSTKETNQHN